MFTYDAVDESQLQKAGLLSDGEYAFIVEKAEARTSSKGNSMLVLTLLVKDGFGASASVTDYLVNTPAAQFKIKLFCDSIGLSYAKGAIREHELIGKKGDFKVGIEDYVDKNCNMKKKNVVVEYIPFMPVDQTTRKSNDEIFKDDNIPF